MLELTKAAKAHILVGVAKTSGRLKQPEICESCGNKYDLLISHHDDYDKPLEVRWLCRSCHVVWHIYHSDITPKERMRRTIQRALGKYSNLTRRQIYQFTNFSKCNYGINLDSLLEEMRETMEIGKMKKGKTEIYFLL